MEISQKKAFPVKIGAVELYCEKMTLSAETTVRIEPTLDGRPIAANKCRYMTQLSFTGRVYEKAAPLRMAGLANNLNGVEKQEIKYRNLRYPNCIITGFKAIDSGEDFIELTVNAATGSIAYFISEEQV